MELKLGRNSRDLKSIFKNEEHTKLLIIYVASTGRLRKVFEKLEDPNVKSTRDTAIS